ncbi:MAG: PIN domain-containing protein [Methylococcaceae bacterium]|jgi:predicted nucleic acid-binding protein
MSAKCFIDSNIFIYAFCDKMASKQVIAKDIILNGSPTISVQVINEVSNNLLKKLQFQENEISSFIVNCYERYSVVNISQETFIAASEIRINHQFSYYDSIIVASALINQCEVLYTEDMQHGKLIANSLKIINPFNDNNIN